MKIVPGTSVLISTLINLQADFIQSTRDFVQTTFNNQRQASQNVSFPQSPQILNLIVRQSTELTNNITRAIGTYNQPAINAIEAARENTKIFERTVDAVKDFNTNIVEAWTNYWVIQQQQFTRAYQALLTLYFSITGLAHRGQSKEN